MSYIAKKALKILLTLLGDAVGKVEWKPIAYEILKEQFIPYIEKKSKDSSNKLDDKAVEYVKEATEKYLGP